MTETMERTKLDRVYRHLHGEIVRGRFLNGERLPIEEELAERFGYSRTTVAKAIRLLARQGLVERRRRAGSFVRAGTAVRSQLLGALICGAADPDPSANVFVPISREIAREAELAGYGVVVRDPLARATDLPAIAAHVERMARELIDRQVAGVLMVPYEIADGHDQSVSARGADLLAEAGIPVVLVDRDLCRYPGRSRFDLVGIDNRRAGCVATEHLLKAVGGVGGGRGRIDFVASDLYGWAQEARIAGYRDALRNAGVQADPRWVHHGLPSDPQYIESIVRDKKVQAVVATNDYTASRLMAAALQAGRRVPGDLRVVGFDDLPYSAGLPVPLTTVGQPVADLGAVAVRTLFDRMRHPARRTTDVTVSFELVVRRSCGARL